MASQERPKAGDWLEDLRREWDMPGADLPNFREPVGRIRSIITELSLFGIVVKSCLVCLLGRPRGRKATCPVCGTVVFARGRRFPRRPRILGEVVREPVSQDFIDTVLLPAFFRSYLEELDREMELRRKKASSTSN